MLVNKWLFIAIIVAIGVLTLGTLAGFEYYTGGNAAKLAQANEQTKHNKVRRVRDAKIAKSIPVDGDAVDGFLLSHTGK